MYCTAVVILNGWSLLLCWKYIYNFLNEFFKKYFLLDFWSVWGVCEPCWTSASVSVRISFNLSVPCQRFSYPLLPMELSILMISYYGKSPILHHWVTHRIIMSAEDINNESTNEVRNKNTHSHWVITDNVSSVVSGSVWHTYLQKLSKGLPIAENA